MIITITHIGDRRKGKQWTKKVSKVDTSRNNGYAFQGSFLQAGENDLSEGEVVLKVGFSGSWKNGELIGIIFQVQNGELVEDTQYSYRKEFLSMRNRIAEFLEEDVNPLSNFSDDDIMAEAKRRNLIT